MANVNSEIFECKSKNNKRVRYSELKILEKHEDKLYFIFGENAVNTKKRYYDDVKTLNEDFEKLKEIKEKLDKDQKEEKGSRMTSMRRIESEDNK